MASCVGRAVMRSLPLLSSRPFLLLVALAAKYLFLSPFPHQFQYADALLHKKNVVEVAACAAAEGRTIMLGVLYDEIARQELLIV